MVQPLVTTKCLSLHQLKVGWGEEGREEGRGVGGGRSGGEWWRVWGRGDLKKPKANSVSLRKLLIVSCIPSGRDLLHLDLK